MPSALSERFPKYAGLWIALWIWFGLWNVQVVCAERLVILHSSEHHGVALPLSPSGDPIVGGLSRRATLVEEIRREDHPVLLLDSGDILIGTAFSSWFKGEPDVLAMNRMGYSAMVAGNHDFDFGVNHLNRLADLAKFPLLCSNLSSQKEPLPCKPSAFVKIGDWRIGLLGIVGRSNFPDTFNRETVKALSLTDPLEAIRREGDRLRRRTPIDIMILLTHQDSAEDLRLLEEAIGVDVIIGGHTEGFDGLYAPGLDHPVASLKFPGRVYVKTHRQGRFLGCLDMTMQFRTLAYAKALNIPVTESIPLDAGVEELLDEYRQRFAQQASRVLGRTVVRLNGERPSVRTQETNLGNLLADMVRQALSTDVALINGGQIRRSLDAGPVTLGDLLAVLPFDSSLVTLQAPGLVLQQALEHGVSEWPKHSGRFLQVSGLRVIYNMQAPVGQRVQEVTVNGKGLQPEMVYSIGTDAFIADGGDGFAMFERVVHRINHQILLRDVLLRFLGQEPLKADLDGRIVIRTSSP